MKSIVLIAVLAGILSMTGCNDDSPPMQPPSVRMDLCVRNASKQNIYAVVQTGSRREDFGIVGAGTGATIGFGFGQVGQTVTVEWTVEDLHGPQQTATLALPEPTQGEVTLTYLADGTWTTAVGPHNHIAAPDERINTPASPVP